MVLTDRVRRRHLIGVAAGGALSATALAGCGLFDGDPEPPPPPDPLQPLLDEALTLAAAYDRLALAQPGLAGRLTPLAADHRTHVAELSRLIGAVPSGGPASSAPAGDTADSVASLRKAEQTAQKTAAAACRVAPADRAGLTGSIAAARAAHAEALR